MHQITVNDLIVDVVRKDVKNLRLTVYPPDGRVRVTAPLRVDDEAVRLFAVSKLAWIKRQQARFAAHERQSAREFISGEGHYYQGDRYLLNVVYHNGPPAVMVRNNTTLELRVRAGSDAAQRERVLLAWYRRQLKAAVPPLIARWETVLGVHVAEWGVKRMKTRWGTCNVKARRIWLNLELVKRPVRCLEYIVVHEMLHLLEPKHNDAFVAHLDRLLPQWRVVHDELNRGSLEHKTWEFGL
jgi:predicted metal-dependent hydrolase